jgi:hypothetical protein
MAKRDDNLNSNPQPGPEVQAALDAARQPAKTAEEVAERADNTVMMVFPHAVVLSTDDHRRISFPAGVNDVPVELKDHRYLAANGVKPYVSAAKVEKVEKVEP